MEEEVILVLYYITKL
ncbi:hypothetical protein Patl1_34661 [Pistacia atlantica]|uniref:Uncharacterized protein n=1 Tax=Pistacia atlantica TaxID=434234 RepID=A0ACC0ZQ35_9ROSI|nr:hypothetical protein Patl1_34661 [Pistacia atlantica]